MTGIIRDVLRYLGMTEMTGDDFRRLGMTAEH